MFFKKIICEQKKYIYFCSNNSLDASIFFFFSLPFSECIALTSYLRFGIIASFHLIHTRINIKTTIKLCTSIVKHIMLSSFFFDCLITCQFGAPTCFCVYTIFIFHFQLFYFTLFHTY